MKEPSAGGLLMKRSGVWLLIVLICMGTLSFSAPQAPTNPKPTISVNAEGKASAKADIAIVFMTVRSTSPLAADALDQNNKKVQDVKARLTALGYKDEQVKFSGNRFAPTGAGIYYPGGQRPTGFDVYNNLSIYLDSQLLNDLAQFNARVSSLLDELSKAGAAPTNTPISSMSMGGSSVVAFSIKDPAPYEKQASLQALEKARSLADEIAQRMKVQITGVESTFVSPMGRVGPQGMAGTPLEEVPYEYFSSSMDGIPVRVRVDVRYTYK
jgi:uncharacterized protein YggE